LAVVAVNMGETAAQVKAYVARHRLSFAHLLDPDQQAVSLLGVPAAPTTILIDHKGRVLGGGLGYRDWASPEAQQLVESLLKELLGK
jgi:peroxiredoxin